MMNDMWGKVHFVLMFVFFNLTFFPMHNLGLGGMMRRIADPTVYEHLKALQPINIFVTLSAFGLGLGTIPFFINFFYSMFKGPKAPINPWESNTLEWTLPSPVTLHGNFEKTPTVYHGPYEYSVPGMVGDHLPQNVPPTPGAQIVSH
jgi:cytochrome c oxidase subunit 1